MFKHNIRSQFWLLFLLFICSKTTVFAQNPCNVWSNFPWHDWISGVRVGTNENISGKSTYSNFTNLSPFQMKTGEKSAVIFTSGFSWENFEESWAVWIDVNHDGQFDVTNELAFAAVQDKLANGNPVATTEGFIKLPPDAQLGLTRMRVAMRRGNDGIFDPCAVLDYGEIEDYLIDVSAGTPPQNCQISVDVKQVWCLDTISDAYRIGFQVVGSGKRWVAKMDGETMRGNVGETYFPAMNSSISVGDWLLTVRDSSNQACKSSDKVTPPDVCFDGQIGQIPQNYCANQASFPWHDWISGVKIGDFESISGKSTYANFTDKIIELSAGQTAPINLTTGFSYATYQEFWKIWLDSDRDGQFDELNEVVFHGISAEPAVGTPTKTLVDALTVPVDALPGVTRMRVVMQRGAFAAACGGIHYGEIEDYQVNILPNAQIQAPNHGFQVSATATPKTPKTTVWPNPATGKTTVFFEMKAAGTLRLRLLDGVGRIVFSENKSTDEGRQSLEMPLTDLPTGLYFWQLEKEGVTEGGKLSVF